MNRVSTLTTAGIVVALVGGTVLLLEPARTQPQAIGLVVLQPTTPGFAQLGSTNITGTSLAGQFIGGGVGLTGVDANLLDGLDSSAFLRPNFPIVTTTADPIATIQAENTANAGVGIKGIVTTSLGGATPSGVYGLNTSAGGHGVLGVSTHPTANVYGGQFQASSPSGVGVYSEGGLVGVFGTTTEASGNIHGVFGLTQSGSGNAVYGYNRATSGTSVGVKGESAGPAGSGLYGVATSSTGCGYGVYGRAQGTSGIGVLGEATTVSGDNRGGYFRSSSGTGVGVYAIAPANGTNIGVWGVTGAANGWGVYSNGRMGATIKLFSIDHPLDPLNKYLQHYCSEGPEPLNVYTGNVTTDAKGEAWVDLPDYFDSINKDFRYTLTVIDDTDSTSFALAKVARKIRDGRFKIRTSEPRIEVTWRVEGVRNDAWMQKYGAPVSVEKFGKARGKYQHPELYDAPPEMGMHWSPDDYVAPKR